MGDQVMITFFAALLAGLSFAAFAYPFLQKTDKKERFKDIIEKRRKDLYDLSRSGDLYKVAEDKSVSAAASMASFYKVQKLAGDMGENVREKLLQAGNRDPSAPIKFMIAQCVLPLFFCGIAMLFISGAKEPPEDTVTLMILFGSAVFGFKLPDIMLKNTILKRREAINLSFADALDLMLICVQGGIGLEQTIQRVTMEIADHSEILAEELGILSAEMSMLNDRRAALQDFAKRVGSGAGKSFATSLIQAEQYGTSISQALSVMSDELREMRMAKAEEKAASLPPKLTVPMIIFFLPALFIIILGPAGIQAGESK